MKKRKTNLKIAAVLFVAFLLWTVLLLLLDVRPIGPLGSSVGLATLNQGFHSLSGVRLWLYTLTDWLSLVPIGIVLGFAALGVTQWLKRKRLRLVDRSVLCLGAFYAAVFAAYALFELAVVNYRPVLINGVLEASYPSSTTLLFGTILPSAILWLQDRIRHLRVRRSVCTLLGAFCIFVILARLLSGVHWLTDIIGGIVLNLALLFALRAVWE